jgi:hypothetical protein
MVKQGRSLGQRRRRGERRQSPSESKDLFGVESSCDYSFFSDARLAEQRSLDPRTFFG